MSTYKVECHRSGGWWALESPDVPRMHTQARRLDLAASIAAEAIATIHGVDESEVVIDLVPVLDDARAATLERMHSARASAERAAQDAAASTGKAALRLHELGMSMRDVGEIMGISHQRVHQLLRT